MIFTRKGRPDDSSDSNESSESSESGDASETSEEFNADVSAAEMQADHPVPVLQETFIRIYEFVSGLIPNLIIACIILFITWLISKYVVRLGVKMVKKTDVRPRIQDLISTLAKLSVWMVGIMIAALVVVPGLTPASLITGLGFGTVAASFATKDILENFLAGVFIMLRKKMRIGDQIECSDIEGRVEHITLRETLVRKPSGEITLVPNSVMFKNPVRILTDAKRRRYELVTGVGYETDLDKATDIIRDAVKKCDGVIVDKGIDIFASKFGGTYIALTIRWWAGSASRECWETRDKAIRAIKIALDDANIEFSDPDPIEIIKH